jgi:hypothetical protein
MSHRLLNPLTTLALYGCISAVLLACGGSGSDPVGPASADTDTSQSAGPVPPPEPGAQASRAPASPTSPTSAPLPGTPTSQPLPADAPQVRTGAPTLADCELFAPEAIFNTRVDDASRFPAHSKSAQWIASVGAGVRFRADWGRSEDPAQRNAYYGIPINVVDGAARTTRWPNLRYDFAPAGLGNLVGWPHESDCAVSVGGGFEIVRGCNRVPADQRRFPFPSQGALTEGGSCNDPATCGDHHLLVVESGTCRLWESYSTYNIAGQWYSLATAAWDLNSLAMRPQGWTSADASGMPMTPFLVKAAEAAQGEIRHALRVTFRDSVVAREFVWPARHAAGSDTRGGIPFGALLRLRSDFVIPSHWNRQARAIATAAKQYGLYVADVGMDFYVQGEPSVAWEAGTFSQLGGIALSDMEFVDLGAVTRDPRFSPDSMAARWP